VAVIVGTVLGGGGIVGAMTTLAVGAVGRAGGTDTTRTTAITKAPQSVRPLIKTVERISTLRRMSRRISTDGSSGRSWVTDCAVPDVDVRNTLARAAV
jgi:hypothetical protein